jgi:hypothetical protein
MIAQKHGGIDAEIEHFIIKPNKTVALYFRGAMRDSRSNNGQHKTQAFGYTSQKKSFRANLANLRGIGQLTPKALQAEWTALGLHTEAKERGAVVTPFPTETQLSRFLRAISTTARALI